MLHNAAVAAHASSPRPAWLFASDGSGLLFANAAGAAALGFAKYQDTERFALPPDLAARIARSAETLHPGGQPRLERLRGLGAAFGQPLTCTCARIKHETGSALLVAATEAATTTPTLRERARYLIEGNGAAAAFGPDGALIHATADAAHLICSTATVSDLGDGVEMLGVGEGVDALTLAFFPANSQPITSPSRVASAQPALLDLSPIAEAITAMTKAPPHRNGRDGALKGASSSSAMTKSSEASGRRHPLRFFWETDAENRFTINGDEFLALSGVRTTNLLGRFWGEISAKLALDPDGRVTNALVSRDTWSGIDVTWPTADGTVAVTLSGIPVFDRDRIFRGYRGLGVWAGEASADDEQRAPTRTSLESPISEPILPAKSLVAMQADLEASTAEDAAADAPRKTHDTLARPASPIAVDVETDDSSTSDSDAVTESHTLPNTENVVPFPFAHVDPKPVGLNPAERSAFRDLGSRLSSRLKGADELARGLIEKSDPREDPPYIPPAIVATPHAQPHPQAHALPDAFAEDETDLATQRPVLDKLPIGILIYRGANFLYANRAFLTFSGHPTLTAFADAGGLDSMHVEFSGSDGEDARRLRVPASDSNSALEGQLVSARVDGESAMVLMLQPAAKPAQPVATERTELDRLLDIAVDGVVTVDRTAKITSANARAERLFGYEPGELAGRAFGDLFAPESERIAKARLDRLVRGDANADNTADDIIGRRRQGGLLALQLTLGRADSAGTQFHALFRDVTRWKDAEKDMIAARHQAEQASAAKSEFLAKISHEMRTPLNAIIGFSEVMMEERFGPVGNERYRDYLKDINMSGAHVVSLLNDLLDLSKIEAGKMELSFERVDLNEVTQQSVAIMQAQANRERVIVRTALSMNIPGIVADTRSVRQIVLNLLSNSIKFTAPGGQVIVSTASGERGDVMLRIRDTGVGMSEKDIETALQPFRQLATSSRTDTNGTGLGLPLTKALVEANRARFSIKSAVNAGTLVEIVFPAARALAQ